MGCTYVNCFMLLYVILIPFYGIEHVFVSCISKCSTCIFANLLQHIEQKSHCWLKNEDYLIKMTFYT